MAKLSFSHEIIESRKNGRVQQEMIVTVDYDPSEDTVDEIEVHIYQGGKHLAEISKLLDKAEGSPLYTIIESINWRSIYADQKADNAERMAESFADNDY